MGIAFLAVAVLMLAMIGFRRGTLATMPPERLVMALDHGCVPNERTAT
jgi:hypothetical protein